jgi:hypothetical protein
MGIGDDLGPDRNDKARLFVQSAVGPFDRLLEASRSEMRERHAGSAEIAERIERAQAQCPIEAFDRRGLIYGTRGTTL